MRRDRPYAYFRIVNYRWRDELASHCQEAGWDVLDLDNESVYVRVHLGQDDPEPEDVLTAFEATHGPDSTLCVCSWSGPGRPQAVTRPMAGPVATVLAHLIEENPRSPLAGLLRDVLRGAQ